MSPGILLTVCASILCCWHGLQVVYDDGIIVRSTANIESGAVVKIATPGSILKATGKVSGLEWQHKPEGMRAMQEINGPAPNIPQTNVAVK